MFREQKYIKVMLTATQVCTESGTFLYKDVQNFKSIPKKIILKFLCDPQNEQIRGLTSQYLGKCTDSVTLLVCMFILISTDPKPFYINKMT